MSTNNNNIRKLAAFRQLSLNCESPPRERRKSLKKQFSEDVFNDNWLDSGIKISLNSKFRKNSDRPPPPIKIAWDDDPEIKSEDVVIIKKLQRAKPLNRRDSIEKESILAEKVKITNEKPNLKIFLAHNSKSFDEVSHNYEIKDPEVGKPKLILTNDLSKNVYLIRKNRDKLSSTPRMDPVSPKLESKAIQNVEIKPSAVLKREMFQKRTNSAFHSTVKESQNFRPPLVRSSSAPSKPDQTKSKFLSTKRRIKTAKRVIQNKSQNANVVEISDNFDGESNVNAVGGADIVTMVSLVSPAGSDNEEVVEEAKCKSPVVVKVENKQKDVLGKNLSLRKTVKSVSFQQSSIHAIRSFSASFPSRRGSMATALMLGNHNNLNKVKANEKRSTPDVAESAAKRKVVKAGTSESQSCKEVKPQADDADPSEAAPTKISVDIQSKSDNKLEDSAIEESDKLDVEVDVEEAPDNKPKFQSAKEKQCWDMYCKMLDKGIQVSYDTILRGMLTPTEYRMSRKIEELMPPPPPPESTELV